MKNVMKPYVKRSGRAGRARRRVVSILAALALVFSACAFWQPGVRAATAGREGFDNLAVSRNGYLGEEPDDGKLTAGDGNGLKVSVSSNEEDPGGSGGLYTGEEVRIALVISNENDNEFSDEVFRLYIQFDSDGYDFDYTDGGTIVLHGKDRDDRDIEVHVASWDLGEGLWSLEFAGADLLPGLTLTDFIEVGYPNGSAGGSVYIFTEFLSGGEVTGDHSPGGSDYEYLTHTWLTESGDLSLTKTTGEDAAFVQGKDGEYYITDLSYTITPSVSVNSMNDSYGTDYVESMAFDDVLRLPGGMTWIDGLAEAVEAGDYRCSAEYTYWDETVTYTLTVSVDGTDHTLGTLAFGVTDETERLSELALYADDDGDIGICWEAENSAPAGAAATTIRPSSYTLSYGDTVIRAEDASSIRAASSFTIRNGVSAVAVFVYDEDTKTAEAGVEHVVSVAKGKLSLAKSSSASGAMYMGSSYLFTVEAGNEGVLPYEGLRYLDDELTNYLYITPEEIEALFASYENLTVTLTGASLYEGWASEEYDYATIPVTSDRSVKDSGLTITFTPDGAGGITMTAAGASTGVNGAYPIGTDGRYSSVAEALGALGYEVDHDVTYSLVWDLGEDFVLEGGASVRFDYTATAKDTFMYELSDHKNFYSTQSWITFGVLNTVYGRDADGKVLESENYMANLYRDFVLYKADYAIFRGGEAADGGAVYDGDVVQYAIAVEHEGNEDSGYESIPLEDQLSEGLTLLAPADQNEALAERDLRTVTVNGSLYYILDREGTYENVIFASLTAGDPATVSATVVAEGGSTMIYSALEGISGDVTVNLFYYTLLRLTEDAGGSTAEFSNTVWLNDHEAHRLYEQTGLVVTTLENDKEIVTGLGDPDDPEDDELTDYTVLSEGEEILYRLAMTYHASDISLTLKGTEVWDSLPAATEEAPWTAERIREVRFVAADGATLSGAEAWERQADENDGSGWYLSGSGTQFELHWTEDLELTFNGTVYIYLTLAFPEGDDWDGYVSAYGGSGVSNTFYAREVRSSVSHGLKVSATAVLQKGVLDTGEYYFSYGSNNFRSRNDAEGLYYYDNDAGTLTNSSGASKLYGYVGYYVALYNEGPSALYLSEIQDVLPTGFTMYAAASGVTGKSNLPACVTDLPIYGADGTAADLKTCSVSASSAEEDGVTRVSFTLGGGDSYTLSYDEQVGKYYLEPGEAVVFTYYVKTNGSASTEDAAENVVAMPFYDYRGGGVAGGEIEACVSATKTQNDGGCEVLGPEEASALGFTVSSGEAQWLTSGVTVIRGGIVPGITKSAASSTALNTDTLEWTVTAYNDGAGMMRDYTITDVMQSPYTFVGDVTYDLYSESYSSSAFRTLSSEYSLFSLGGRGTDGAGDYVELTWHETAETTSATRLYLDGEELPLTVFYSSFSSHPTSSTDQTTVSACTSIAVSLSKDDDGNEILAIRFMEDIAAIYPGGYGVLRLHTRNDTGDQYNSNFYNTAYVTPDSQSFESYEVTKGSFVEGDQNPYVEGDSVRASGTVYVYFGYATASEKSVAEVENPSNKADSDANVYSDTYLTLTDENSVFRYTLAVTNGAEDHNTDFDMRQLVLIDNLPEVGDTYTSNNTVNRDSAFQVGFAPDPAVEVTLEGTLLTEGADYRVEYSDAVPAYTAQDWNGSEDPGKWYDGPRETSRSIRITFLFNNEESANFSPGSSLTDIPTGSTVRVSFDAVAEGGDASPGDIAWNSFAYHYTTNINSSATAAPLDVGVRIASAPLLIKELTDDAGDRIRAAQDMEFTYVIYPGSTAVTGWTDPESLIEALRDAGISVCTLVRVSVPAGSDASDPLSLAETSLTECSTETGEPTGESWSWTTGAPYTIVEADSGGCEFKSWNSTRTTNSYTFTYSSGATQVLTNENEGSRNLTLTLRKVDADSGSAHLGLDGAWFTLSRTTGEGDGAVTSWCSVDPDTGAVEWETSDGGSVPAFSLGSLVLEDLSDGAYELTEVRAPDGYSVLSGPVAFIIDAGVFELTEGTAFVETEDSGDFGLVLYVRNEAGAKLPDTGGSGTVPCAAAGVTLVGGAACLLRRRRREGGDAG